MITKFIDELIDAIYLKYILVISNITLITKPIWEDFRPNPPNNIVLESQV